MASKLIVESDKQNSDGGYTVTVSYHATHNAHLIATTDEKIRKLKQPCQLFFAALHHEDVKNPQAQEQSSFFAKLPLEVREKVYEKMIESKFTVEFFDKACDCICESCQVRRYEESMGELFLRSRGPVIRSLAKNGDLLNLFRTCRRIYDEARPVLQQVNDLIFDGGIGRIPLLRQLIRPLTYHRGLRMSEAVLLSATFMLSKTSSSTQTSGIVNDFANAINRAYRSGPYLQIRKLKVILYLCEHTTLKDFEVLLGAMRLFQGVIHCTVDIHAKVKKLEFDDYMILKSITRALEESDLELNDPLAEARGLLEDGYTGNVFTVEDHRAEDKKDVKSINNHFEAVMQNTEEFLAANRASDTVQSELDARATEFQPGDRAYVSRAALLLL